MSRLGMWPGRLTRGAEHGRVEWLWHYPAGRLYWLALTAPNREPIYTPVGLAVPSLDVYSAEQPGFIWELCIALEHRWKPNELFVIFTAYFDESGTHGPTPTVILASFLGHAREWELFERRLRRLQREYGFTVFHAKEFKANDDEFRGWSDDKKKRLISDLTELVRDNLTEGVTIALSHDRYVNEYRAPPVPKGMSLDSQYGVCFRACLSHIVSVLQSSKKRHRLHVVIEDNQRYGDCKRIFSQAKRHLEAQGINLLGTIIAAKKQASPPLMVADFFAHTIYLLEKKVKTGLRQYAEMTDELPPKGDVRIMFLELLPDALYDIKRNFEEGRRIRVEKRRTERAARKASVGSSTEQPS
jgi:hypothetical protein